MAMLTSGEYSLNTKNVANERKSMLFVKLTDSAQRALNDYFSNLQNWEVPYIEFNNTQGRILIPTCPKGDAESENYMAQFKFDVTSNLIMQGMQGRFECVQHKVGGKQLIKCGQFTQRLRIHANEDVYETTKNRMAAIELAQRKNCTRQLDWHSTTNMNRKVKLERFVKSSSNTSTPIIKCKDAQRSVPKFHSSNMVRSKNRPINNATPQKFYNIAGDRSPPNNYKRPGYINGADGFLTKRQRISHFVKHEPRTTSTPEPKFENSPLASRLENWRPVKNEFVEEPKTNQKSKISYSLQPEVAAGDVKKMTIVAENGMSNLSQQSAVVDGAPQVEEKPKYLKDYVPIINMQQRRKYKTDFSEIFKEYERVHEEIDNISNTFAEMGESLRQHKKGTPKYSKIEAEIFKKYYSLKRCEKFQAAKRRFEYLHEKLSHIKNLVHDYDAKIFKDETK